jgi:hypothetical protein
VTPVEIPESTDSLTAYALGAGGKIVCAVIINRGTSDVRISVAGLGFNRRLAAMRLLAPSANSKTDVTFAGASVDTSGKWAPTHIERIPDSEVPIPKLSAVVLRS